MVRAMTERNRRETAGPWGDRLEPSTDEAMYRALVENLPAVIYQVAPDDDRRTMYVSPHVETALGYSREEWLGQPDIWMELLHPDDREQILAAHDLHNETGRPWSREYRLIANDGRVVWFRDVATLVRDNDGHPEHWLGVQLDITELKAVEGELRGARDELEQRVAERTAELEEANALMSLEIGERRRAEADLRAAEHRYRLLAEQIPAVTYIWESTPDGEPQYYESTDRAAAGYTVDEWLARKTSGCLACTRTTAPACSPPLSAPRPRASRSRWSSATCTRMAASSGWPTRRS
jgi:PAS domain S-box-containing protein